MKMNQILITESKFDKKSANLKKLSSRHKVTEDMTIKDQISQIKEIYDNRKMV